MHLCARSALIAHSSRLRFVRTDASAQHRLLIDHIAKLRTLPALRSCQAVLGLESNLGFEAQHALHSIRRAGVRNWCALMEGVDGTCGLLTTNASKEVMCVALQQLLAANHIHVAANMLSISLPPQEALDQLIQELRGYMIFVDPPKTLFAKPRRTFTGKVGGHNDDVAIALQLAVLTMQIFTRSEKYTAFQN